MAASILAGCFGPLACPWSTPPAKGQFGEHSDAHKILRFADGDTVTVYRVKYWVFADSEPPALQLEYAARTSTAGTDAMLAYGRRLWPAFAPYVERLNLSAGILTATQLTDDNGGTVRLTRTHWYGLIARRGADGTWRFQGHPEAPPPADQSGRPRIFEADGSPVEFSTTPPRIQ